MKIRYNKIENFIVGIKKFGMRTVYFDTDERSTPISMKTSDEKEIQGANTIVVLKMTATDDKIYLNYSTPIFQGQIMQGQDTASILKEIDGKVNAATDAIKKEHNCETISGEIIPGLMV